MLRDEELKSLDYKEAKEQLSEEELERYNTLKSEKLQEGIDEKKFRDSEDKHKVLETLRLEQEKKLTKKVNILGQELTIYTGINESDVKDFHRWKKEADMDVENSSEEDLRRAKNICFEILGKFTKDFSVEDWKKTFSDSDITVVNNITERVVSVVDEELDQKKR